MTKYEFNLALRKELAGLPPEDVERSIEFYGEMIDDRMEEGLPEDEAVAAVGTVEALATQIWSEASLPRPVKECAPPKQMRKGWKVALLILGSPVWLSLLVAAAAVVLSTYVVLWSAVISLYAVALSCAVSGIAGLLGTAVYLSQDNLPGVAFGVGAGLACIGITIFLFMGCTKAAKAMVWLTKKLPVAIRSCFIKKEAAK